MAGLVAGLALLLIALLPTGPDREAPPVPQSSSRFLRNPTGPALAVDDAALADAQSFQSGIGEAEAAFLHTVDPRTFLPPYTDSVLLDHPRWICDSPAPADALHVATDGDDAAPGTVDRPLATISSAVDRAQPGQQVLVRGGTYREAVTIRGRSGRADAWITLRSYPGERAVISVDVGQNAVALRQGSSYINIACLELAGPTERPEAIPASPGLMRERRLAGAGANDIPQNYGAGVDVGDQSDTRAGQLSHHVRIVANEVHDFAEMGISAVEVSHITIAGNTVYRNARYSCHAGSGIGIGYMLDTGGPDNADGYTNYIVGNIAYANENRSLQCFSDSIGAVLTDGNGIIVDDDDSNGYQARTLVADNLVFGNGGRGILVFNSSRVDVLNNIAYHNANTPDLMGRGRPHPDIAVANSADVRVYNNIAVPRDGNRAFVTSGDDVDARANLFTEPGPGTDLFATPGLDGSADFTIRPEAADRVAGGIPFLMTVGQDGQPAVVDPATLGTVFNTRTGVG